MAKWLKLDTNILSDEKISLIRSMPAGDSLIVLWIGLICLAMKRETDVLYIAQGVPYGPAEIAKLVGIEVKTVQMGLAMFEKYEMISVQDDGAIVIANLQKHQALDKLEHQRLLTADRVRRYRKRTIDVTRNSALQVTRRNAIDLDIDIDLDKEEDKDSKLSSCEAQHDVIPYVRIIDTLNATARTRYSPKSKATRRLIKARWNDGYRLENFEQVIATKCAEWKGNDAMLPYLRPQTLFGTKFESYLQKAAPKSRAPMYEVIDEG